MEIDRKFPDPILVFLIAYDFECVGEHYYVEELACLYSLILAVFLTGHSSRCSVGYSRYLL